MSQPDNNTDSRETIGRCENCGLVDHNLIAGLCPGCDEKSLTIDDSTEDIATLLAMKTQNQHAEN